MASNNQEVLLFAVTLTLLLRLLPSQIEAVGSKVERLPGFDGPLPFHLETGYIGLGDSDDDMQVFYYFVKSENDPQNDPLLLWLTGGPGCSSFSGLVYQIGPVKFKIEEYDGSLPKLILRPQSWTKVANIIFVDLPMGTGYSYTKTVLGHRSDWKMVHQTHRFIRKWLAENPEFLSNKFYMAADSYSGIPVPPITQEIADGNERGLEPRINLQGYILGNPLTSGLENNDRIPYVHGMGLISDELYLSLKQNCNGDIINVDSTNELCLNDMQYYYKLLENVELYNILEIYCVDEKLEGTRWNRRRSVAEKIKAPLISSVTVPDMRCQIHGFFLGTEWMNDPAVRKALHIREGSIGKWTRCYKDNYVYDIPSSVPFHANLSAKGYPSLIYSGDHDAVVPFSSTQRWIRSLNYSIVDDWRPWYLNDQVAGYTRTYSNQMTFATIRGAGHTAPETKPEEGFVMFVRWISNKPL
ncbi:hypothetical protein PIB30_066027 [Stylosanthes scabra]|uniref:Uncharacterized protein n=1 Tax=Stylosanthes scabra TaxID=79078 RepID=A0ABU6QMV6_9FABA|nr:hypothetical protein [Stylosanthes scabra]